MKTYRSTLLTMRLLFLVCHLGLILRTKAQIPDKCSLSETNRAPENLDITVFCGTENMDLSIYICPMYNALYNESLMVLNNQFNKSECFGSADWSVDPPVLKFRIPINESAITACSNNFKITSETGNGEFADFSRIEFVNISGTVTSVDPSAGMITYRPRILYTFSCSYPMQYILNNAEVAVAGVNLAIQGDNGSFISTLSMELYEDEQYQDILTIPQTGVRLKTRIYVEVKATNLTDRFNVLLDRCYTTASPYDSLNTYYDLFVGCQRDAQTKVELNGESQKAQFSFEAFRFVEHKNQTVSTFYLHCVTRLCEVSSCGTLLPNCGSLRGLSKRNAPYTSDSATVTSSAIRVEYQSTDPTLEPSTKHITSSNQTETSHEIPKANLASDGVSSVNLNRSTLVAAIVCSVIVTICFST